MDQPGVIGWGHNSGFHALNLAAQFGARRIVLVGYDASVAHGVHWHGKHERMGNPVASTCEKWRRALDGVAPQLAALGVEVLNASPISALTAYPKCTLEESLAWAA